MATGLSPLGTPLALTLLLQQPLALEPSTDRVAMSICHHRCQGSWSLLQIPASQ